MVDYIYLERFISSYLEPEGLTYTRPMDHVLRIIVAGENWRSIPLILFFDKEGEPIVQLRCWPILNFKGKETVGMCLCNELNGTYRWARFVLNNDGDIEASYDLRMSEDNSTEDCRRAMLCLAHVADDAFPTLAQALWADQ